MLSTLIALTAGSLDCVRGFVRGSLHCTPSGCSNAQQVPSGPMVTANATAVNCPEFLPNGGRLVFVVISEQCVVVSWMPAQLILPFQLQVELCVARVLLPLSPFEFAE